MRTYEKVWEVMPGILLLGTSCCCHFVMAHHVFFFSFPAFSFLKSLFQPHRIPETLPSTEGGGGGRWGRWRWGASFKGIITVSPEEVHNHSVKLTGGVGREGSTFSVSLPPWVPRSLKSSVWLLLALGRSLKTWVLPLLSGGPGSLSP